MDIEYWDKYYKRNGTNELISDCSTFAAFCLDNFFVDPGMTIIELGCGNGRDAVYFAQNELKVVALDQSITGVKIAKKRLDVAKSHYLDTVSADFVKMDYAKYTHVDAFYSRFTIHSISSDDEAKLLPKIFHALNSGGLFCIEVRTTSDPLYGIGENCGDNTFSTDHRRRFVNSDKFLHSVLALGFKLVYFTERDNLSVYKDDNPVLMRIVLQKQ